MLLSVLFTIWAGGIAAAAFGFVVAAVLPLLRMFNRSGLAGDGRARFFARLTLMAIVVLAAFWFQIFLTGLFNYKLGHRPCMIAPIAKIGWTSLAKCRGMIV